MVDNPQANSENVFEDIQEILREASKEVGLLAEETQNKLVQSPQFDQAINGTTLLAFTDHGGVLSAHTTEEPTQRALNMLVASHECISQYLSGEYVSNYKKDLEKTLHLLQTVYTAHKSVRSSIDKNGFGIKEAMKGTLQ